MTADSGDNFEYEPVREHESEAARRHYWAVAIGLQAVDGLKVSPYVEQLSQEYVKGTKSLSETGELIRAYHASGNGDADDPDTAEADLVSQRIVELLSDSPFFLGSEFLAEIHRRLFQDLDPVVYHPGEFKNERMVKQEDILNGDSVLYADPTTYNMSLRAAFTREFEREYTDLSGQELEEFVDGIAFLWQIHPFYEGNTRTVAVFSELYLRSLGFGVTNEPFQEHSRFYRDALVRAIYRNPEAKIFPDQRYLVEFYENVLGRSENALDREQLLCPQLFDHPELLKNVDPAEALSRASS